jgi:CBS domain containing-hemolysin-like protein
MTSLYESIPWLVAAGCIGVAALCSGMEIACYAINRVRLALRAGRVPQDAAARIIRAELDQPDRLLATLLVWMNIATYAGALAITELLERNIHSPALVALVNTCVLSPVLFIFGEALPKELFRIEADRLAYRFARPLAAARGVLTLVGPLPLVQVLTRIVERLSGLPRERMSDARQRIALLLKEGAGHGVLSESQVTLVDRALMLRGVTVGDEMVPWSLVRSVPLDADRARALKIIGASRHARVPVVGSIESIAQSAIRNPQSAVVRWGVVGMLEQIDLYAHPQASIAELVKPVVRLKRSMRVREALLLLREHKSPMGVVEDDDRPLGIVTARDLVEPLTGELADV